MLISGVQKFTILDYPGKVACMIFAPYCNFRCPYCHNSEDVLPERIEKIKSSFIPEEIFFNFLKTRVGFIDGVVITGGEPTLQQDLKEFIIKIKKLGFIVKLDTNGTNPKIVNNLIDENLLDFIAMDVKSDFGHYKSLSGFIGEEPNLINSIKESINIIMNSGVDYEFRTTIAKSFISKESIFNIGKMISGCKKYALQNFRKGETVLDQSFNNSIIYGPQELEDISNVLKNDFNIKLIELRR